MQLHISPRDGTPIYQQIANQIKYQAASGRLEAGRQLPTVRKLAEQLTVNPNTVARAYRELEAAGVLTTRRGSGTFVAEGGSPLARREKVRILHDRIDLLLAESRQMGVDLETLLQWVRERDQHLSS